MATTQVRCIDCTSTQVYKHGYHRHGEPRYRCREANCRRRFILNYIHQGCLRAVKQQAVEMS